MVDMVYWIFGIRVILPAIAKEVVLSGWSQTLLSHFERDPVLVLSEVYLGQVGDRGLVGDAKVI